MKKIVALLIFGLLNSCTNNEDIIRSSFTNEEYVTVDKIIKFYDDFIYSQTVKTYPIEKAYEAFLNKTIPLVLQAGDLSPLSPETNEKIIFYKTLNRNAYISSYRISDFGFHNNSDQYNRLDKKEEKKTGGKKKLRSI